jgi:hypothetical protein
MTGPEPDANGTKPISVAELLAKNGTLGAPAVTRRRRRRRGDTDTVTVAELTGEIPIIRDADDHGQAHQENKKAAPPARRAAAANGGAQAAQTAVPQPRAERVPDQVAPERVSEKQPKTPYWSEPEPRWPKSQPRTPGSSGPERSAYPRPLRSAEAQPAARTEQPQSGAEEMSPDPVDHYVDIPVDVMDSDVREAEPAIEDSAYVRSYLQASEGTLFGGQTIADELARRRGDERAKAEAGSPRAGSAGDKLEEKDPETAPRSEGRDIPAPDAHQGPGKLETLWRGSLIVLQSMLAVSFGAGLFIAFDQLWRWNSIVALVLSVLVILGLVVGVRVVRKTEDIPSTLIAVAVGALITLGPLALSLQSS